MRILSHYFVARFFGLFLTVLVAALAILATIELVLNIEELEELGTLSRGTSVLGPTGSIVALVRFLWTRIVTTYLVDLLPIASFIASFTTFALAGRRLEWIAIESGGIRPLRIILPVLVGACFLSLIAGLVH